MTGQLVKDLEFIGDTEHCKAILNGTYSIPNNVDSYTAEYIKALAKPSNIINAPKLVISIVTFIEGWKKMKERTSTGLSGIYFEHLKAYAMLEELADFKATICHIPYATRYSSEESIKLFNKQIIKGCSMT